LEIKEAGHGAACGYYMSPENAGLLKRLEACHYLDGKAMPCGCVIAQIESRLPKDLKLKEWIGARGTVALFLNGFSRNSGKAFSESIYLPIEIVK
ncbi:MAG: hypothetical protein NTV86_19525, partial [Planctomycetota bacterium]|nr:hypothetical protein [Planctomycetota bacterium]